MKYKTTCLFAILLFGTAVGGRQTHGGGKGHWDDPDASVEERVEDLLSQLSTAEKVEQLHAGLEPTGAIERLGIPGFQGWSECLHGGVDFVVGSKGHTIFPQPIALAATFDTVLMGRIAMAIGDELRAKNNLYKEADAGSRHINCFGPNINIARDPRWGRLSETYGEDPYLTSRMAIAFVRALQANHSRYLKVGATCKHFAAYSMELSDGYSRHSFNARLLDRDLQLTYSPAFRACVQEGGAASVMCSYNAVNGAPACANPELLQGVLRESWGFQGFVVSDCGAIDDVAWPHEYANTSTAGYAAALKAGTDMGCTNYNQIHAAHFEGLVTDADVDLAARRVLRAKVHLGVFDPPEEQPYSSIRPSVIGSPHHLELAQEAARKSIVLLKNRDLGDGTRRLPLNPSSLQKVVLMGPHANSTEHLLGNYYRTPAGGPEGVTSPLQAFRAALGRGRVTYRAGAHMDAAPDEVAALQAAQACKTADVCIFFLGLSAINEHTLRRPEDTCTLRAARNEAEGGDRELLTLPSGQMQLVKLVARLTDTPLVVVLIHGGPVDVQWLAESERIDAMMTAWYPGQGAAGIVDVVLGKAAPSGRLPVTFYYTNYTQQVAMTDMDMVQWPGRTYRYLQVPVLYPFGFGLSYTEFSYQNLTVTPVEGAAPHNYDVSVRVANAGRVAAEEVVLLYLDSLVAGSDIHVAPRSLRGFARVFLFPGGTHLVKFSLGQRDFEEVIYPWTTDLDPKTLCQVSVGDLRASLEGGGEPRDS